MALFGSCRCLHHSCYLIIVVMMQGTITSETLIHFYRTMRGLNHCIIRKITRPATVSASFSLGQVLYQTRRSQ